MKMEKPDKQRGRPPGSTNRPPDPRPLILRAVPGALKREFKIQCAREGVPMSGKMIELMKKYIEGVER